MKSFFAIILTLFCLIIVQKVSAQNWIEKGSYRQHNHNFDSIAQISRAPDGNALYVVHKRDTVWHISTITLPSGEVTETRTITDSQKISSVTISSDAQTYCIGAGQQNRIVVMLHINDLT